MMKNVCFTLVLGCFFNIFFAKAAYVPVPVTGFNADVVANGTGSPSTSTTATLNYDVPTSGVVLVAPDYRYMASCSLPTASLPANRIVNGTTAGLTFELAPYDAPNCLHMTPSTPSGTLTFQTPLAASTVYLLGHGGNTVSAAPIMVEVRFTDNTIYRFHDVQLKDWSASGPYALQTARVSVNVSLCNIETPSNNPRLFEVGLQLPAEYWGKQIAALYFDYASGSIVGYPNIMAISVKTACDPPSAPTGLNLSAISSGQVNGSFTGVSPTPAGYLTVSYPSGATPVAPQDGMTYTTGELLGDGIVVQVGTSTSFSATALSAAMTYDFYVYAYGSGGADCDGPVYSAPLSGSVTTPSCTGLSGTYTVGPGGHYLSLTDALGAIFSGISGPVTFELQSNYTTTYEAFPITIKNINNCISATNPLTIRPAAGANGLEIVSSNGGPTIFLDGARYVTIDGMPGGSVPGDTISYTPNGAKHPLLLSIRNTSTSGMAIQMNNGASYNTVKYCDLQGRNTAHSLPNGTGGVVYFGPNGTGGNDRNTITYCNVHSSQTGNNLPAMGIYVRGPVNNGLHPNFNNEIVISHCNIYDYFIANGKSIGVGMTEGVQGCTVTGNSFFQTATRTVTGSDMYHRAIYIHPVQNSNGVGNGFVITGNYIGGTLPKCQGTPYTLTGSSNHFVGIRMKVKDGPQVQPTIVRDNVITNISQTTTTTTQIAPFMGISFYEASGSVTIENNIIGGATGNDLIKVSAGSGSTSNGISLGGGNAYSLYPVKNNIIGGITMTGSGNSFYGIQIGSDGRYEIDSNLIGSETTTHSIHASNTSGAFFVRGIAATAKSPHASIRHNVIANLTHSGTSTTGSNNQVVGIWLDSRTDSWFPEVSGNIIRNLESSSRSNSGGIANSAIIGIAMQHTPYPSVISDNLIHSFLLRAPTQAVHADAVVIAGSATSGPRIIARNFIHSLDVVSGNNSATIRGISLRGGPTQVINNMVRLGIRPDGNSLGNAIYIFGIHKSSSELNRIYHNSVYIGGTTSSTNSFNTAAFRRESTGGADTLINNILANARSNSSSGGRHFSIWTNNNSGVFYSHNIYGWGTGTSFACQSSTGSTNLIASYTPGWMAGDLNSLTTDPEFINPDGDVASVDLHITQGGNTPVEGNGLLVSSVTDDMDGELRAGLSPVDIGADASNFLMNVTVAVTGNNSPVCGTDTIKLTATASDPSAVIQWSGPNNFTATGPTVEIPNADLIHDGVYRVWATLGAVVSDTVDTVVVVNPAVIPSVSISSGSGTSICANQGVLFTATPNGGGTSPSYEWRKNGTAVGTGGMYTDNGLANNDVITCLMTSNATCARPDTALSNTLTMTVISSVTPSVTIAADPGTSVCAGTQVTFTATLQNSGASPVYQWRKNGLNVGSGPVYVDNGLANNDVITCELTSSAACATPTTVTSNALTMSVTPLLTPSVSIAADPGTAVCAGMPVTFTATPVNGGTSPVYQWQKNGVSVGTGPTYLDNGLANNDAITCELTSSAACVTPTTATSNTLTMSVTPTVTPSVSIAANPGTSICSGAPVNFTATPVNGGSGAVYQWRKNGVVVGTGSTYADNGLAHNDVITCRLTSSVSCAVPDTVLSNTLTMTVTPTVTPSVSIAANPGTSICSGTPVTFTATSVNEGLSPAYQWRKNGTAVGTGPMYSDNGLAHNDVITCELTSSAACATPATTTSNVLTMSVTPTVTPSVSIAANPGTTICSSTPVTFTATALNGGASPAYQWRKNGTAVGTGPTYADNGLANNDVITCTLTSNAACANPTTATSNALTMTVNPTVTPSVSIAANPGTSICGGTPVTFTATPVNGGASPVYQWRRNGTNVGTGPTYTDNGLANNDVITCQLTSGNACAVPTTATSNTLTMSVTPTVTPSVSILANPGTSICSGTPVTFTATPVNGGTAPAYQWRKNGSPVGTGTTYMDNSLAQGDVITCRLTSNAVCPTPDSAISNTLSMTVTQKVTPAVSISSDKGNKICAGTLVTFTATPMNGGAAPNYQWYKNGLPTGSNSNTHTDNGLADGDIITCRMTSSIVCVTVDTALSAGITMQITSLDPSITPSGAAHVCEGDQLTLTADAAGLQYQWRRYGAPIGGATGRSYAVTKTGDYSVSVSDGSCSFTTDTPVSVTIHPTPKPKVFVNRDTLFTDNFYASYQWYLNGQAINGATSFRHIAVTAGMYYVIVVDTNGCTANSAFYTVDKVGMHELYADDVQIYPNPAQDLVFIRAPFPVRATMQAADGRRIQVPETSDGIRIGELPNGVYMISVADQNGVIIRQEKLIKLGR